MISRTGLTTLSNATVGNWLAAGCPRNPDGTLSLLHVCAWLAAERRKPQEPAPKPAASTADELRKSQKALTDLKVAERRGELFDRAEVLAMFEEAASRMRAVLEAVERNHGPSVGATIRAALAKSFANIETALAPRPDQPA